MSTQMKPREILVQTNHGLIFTVVVPQESEEAQSPASIANSQFGTAAESSRGGQPRTAAVRNAS
ncbi:hypothetical protein [Rosistilla oblonga]|uniref:hypothetical protein n=1 Tax=Rosistilla oblonga TaxID=2527990 RepID=UPI0011A2A720|nr:hypothetical protein [Rosistilla oblonga]